MPNWTPLFGSRSSWNNYSGLSELTISLSGDKAEDENLDIMLVDPNGKSLFVSGKHSVHFIK